MSDDGDRPVTLSAREVADIRRRLRRIESRSGDIKIDEQIRLISLCIKKAERKAARQLRR